MWPEQDHVLSFLDNLAPTTIRFFTDHYVCGNTYRSVWAFHEYPGTTEEQAILRGLGEREGVTLHIYTRHVTYAEQRKMIANAARKNKLVTGNTHDVQETVQAESNLQDVIQLILQMRKNKEPLLHCAIFLELISDSPALLKELQSEILMELTRNKISVDKLLLRQQEGFISVMPTGCNVFQERFERVHPASAVADLYPLNYSGKTDKEGFYLGKDKFGSNLIVDFHKMEKDKTNGNILILGNSGQGKSYLMKLIETNFLESGKSLYILDPEGERKELCENLGGTYLDMLAGEYLINVLEPKQWNNGDEEEEDTQAPAAFRGTGALAQHISFLKDFFRSYKNFQDRHIDTLEIFLLRLYRKFDINEATDLRSLKSEDYPILENLYADIEYEYAHYDETGKYLYTKELLQELCLSLYSLCRGGDRNYFNGITNIPNDRFLVFGIKGLMEANESLKNAVLFNILSYMSNKLLDGGNAVASIDELYLFLTNLTAVVYIRNLMKRVRKRDSHIMVASQNLEDYMLPDIKEFTKPLFAIPAHQFLFNAGTIDSRFYMDMLQLEQSEFDLIRYPERGNCLYKCGNERYNLQVIAPTYKEALFGIAGGR